MSITFVMFACWTGVQSVGTAEVASDSRRAGTHLQPGHVMLTHSYRLPPSLCQFVSDHMYSGKLKSAKLVDENTVQLPFRWVKIPPPPSHFDCMGMSISSYSQTLMQSYALIVSSHAHIGLKFLGSISTE